MKYKDKKYYKLKNKLKKFRSGDGDEDEDIYNPLERDVGNLLTHGKSKNVKSINLSHKKRVGNIINKDVSKRYDGIQKTIDRMSKGKR